MDDRINYKFPRVIVMQFYRLLRFNIQKVFCNILSVMVYDSVQPVMYTRKFCKNNPGHKIYGCIPAGFTWHFILLHITTILRTKKFLRHPINRARKYCLRQNCHILHWYTHTCFIRHIPLLDMIQTQIWVKKHLFPSLRLGLGLCLGPNNPLACSRYISFHTAMRVYFIFIYTLFEIIITLLNMGDF